MYKPYLCDEKNIKPANEYFKTIADVSKKERSKLMIERFIRRAHDIKHLDTMINKVDSKMKDLSNILKKKDETYIDRKNIRRRILAYDEIEQYKNDIITLFDIALYFKDRAFIKTLYKEAIDILDDSAYELASLAYHCKSKWLLKKIFKDVYVDKNSMIELCDIEDDIVLNNDTYVLNILAKYYFTNRDKDELSQDLQNTNGYHQFLENPDLRDVVYRYFKSIRNSIEMNKQIYLYLASTDEDRTIIKKLTEISDQWHLYNFIKRQIIVIEKMNSNS